MAIHSDSHHGRALGLLRRAATGRLLSVCTVALVVGAGSAVLAVANATLIRPLPFPVSDRLAQINLLPPDVTDPSLFNPLHPLALVKFQERLTLATGPGGAWSRERAIGGAADPESVEAADVSASFFDVLGVRPLLGRTWRTDEDRDGAAVVVLGHALWQRRFGGDPAVLGRSVDLDGVPHQVIGVMPVGFSPAFVPSQLWTPLGVHEGNLRRAGATYILSVVRMHDAVTIDQLDAEVRRIGSQIAGEGLPAFRGWTAHARTLRDAQYGDQRAGTLLLLLAVGALALIAILNLAHVGVTRAMARRAETALRLALGARPGHLIRAGAAEATVVAFLGGLFGLALAQWLLPVLLALDPSRSLPRDAASLDWRLLAATFSLALVVTLGAAVWPLVRQTRRDPREALTAGDRGSPAGGFRTLRLALIGLETALACVLVSSSLVLFTGFRQDARLDPGFDADHLLGAQVRLIEQRYGSVESRGLLMARVLEELRASPGVEAAGTTMNRLIPGFSFVTLAAPGDPPPADAPAHTLQFRRVSDGYFEAMKIPVLEGRGFLADDARTSQPVVVVSRLLADRFWPGRDAVGQRLQRRTAGSPVLTVVSVVGDVSDVGFGQAPQATLYVPYRQENNTNTPLTLVVRTAGPPLAVADAVRQAVRRVDPAQPVSGIVPLRQFLDDSLGPARLRSTLLGVFALLGLLLAALGIYGVTARNVVERTREAGIRLALGGPPARVFWTMASRVLAAVAAGVVAGLALSRGTERLLVTMLPDLAGTSAPDAVWLTFTILAATGGVAAVLPARRAARVNPIIALRAERPAG